MNIKRAFLAAAAVLVMAPGLAMAQVTVNFLTTLDLPDSIDSDTQFNARLECNQGSQLVQNFPVSGDVPVDFIVEEFDLAWDDTLCTLSLTAGANGFEDMAYANGYEMSGDCAYTLSSDYNGYPDYDYDSVAIAEENTCSFEFEQMPFEYTINKVWDFDDDEGVFQLAAITYTCYNVYSSPPNDDKYGPSTYSDTYPVFMDYYDEMDVEFYANPYVGSPYSWSSSYCMAEEEFQYDSAVESDGGCLDREYFSVGKSTGECTITNSVFFEGIPTLSQYGLAIMALLMLGVGFVGFRRFV